MIGAISGGVIGDQVGRGSGQALATFAGVLLGSVVGGQIGRDLDDAERLKLASATQYALENQRSGTRTVWDNPDRRVTVASSFPNRPSRTNSTSIAGSSSSRSSSTAKSKALVRLSGLEWPARHLSAPLDDRRYQRRRHRTPGRQGKRAGAGHLRGRASWQRRGWAAASMTPSGSMEAPRSIAN